MSLLIAVSSAFFREGIRKSLEPEKEIEIMGEASTHQEIISLLEQSRPGVLFIDSAIPNLDILKILESIKKNSVETKVLLLLHRVDEEAIINLLSIGVWGYLTDASNTGQFIQAIRAVSRGEMWAERKIITKALTRLLPSPRAQPGLPPPTYQERRGDRSARCFGEQQQANLQKAPYKRKNGKSPSNQHIPQPWSQ